MTNCGLGGSGTESCCTSLLVTGGTFYRSYDNDGYGWPPLAPDGGPAAESNPATVSDFRLDKYLVTVGRFRQFVNAVYPDGGATVADAGLAWVPDAGSGKHSHLNGGKGLANSGPGGGYETGWAASDDVNIAPTNSNLSLDPGEGVTWTPAVGNQENLPIDWVNWYEAYAFCIWDGGFLPSEAEWEYAAAGGSQQREFPWGSTDPDTQQMPSQYAIYDCDYSTDAACWPAQTNLAPVGTAYLGAGRWGQLDLEGEANEWCLDWFQLFYVDPCSDCAYLAASSQRVGRGGNFDDAVDDLVVSLRAEGPPTNRFQNGGFRCARSP
jgi:formylglycine-generating enzyme required for sulfatase activity